MAIVAALLDKARATRSIPSDLALAERLGISRQAVSNWRHGDKFPDEETIAQLALLAGDDPAQWLVAIKAVRTDGVAGKAWAALAKRLGAAAAVVLVAALPYTGIAKPVAKAVQAGPDCALCEMFSGLRYLGGCLKTWLAHVLRRRKPSPDNVEVFAWI